MRVLHYIASFFPHERGATHSALLLARGLRDLGVHVSFIVEDQGEEWRNGGEYDGFPVRSFPLTHPGKIRKIFGFLKLRRFMKQLAGSTEVFHIHAAPYMNLLLARLGSNWLNAPALVKITSDGWDTPDGVRSSRHGRFALPLYRAVHAVVAMTSGQAVKCHDGKLRGLIDVIPNGVNVDHFRPVSHQEKIQLRQKLGLPLDQPIMVYAGWLGHGKGTDILFNVWNHLRASYPGIGLLLVGNYMGSQNMAAPLDHFLQQHNLSGEWARDPAVFLVGKTPDIAPYLQAADIFVFPSRREGFGTVQIEAMACGLPCVVNELPGVSSDIFPDDTTGIRIQDNHIPSFVKACEQLLSNPHHRSAMGTKARERAVSFFSQESVARRYLDLYQRMLKDRPGKKTA